MPPRPGPRTSSRVISIVVAVIGGMIVLGTLASVAFSAVAFAGRQRDDTTVVVAGVDKLDLDVSGGELTVTYDGVSEAELIVDRGFGSGQWTFENDGGTLTVASPDQVGFGWPFDGHAQATLKLPASLLASTLDGVVQVNGGTLSLMGGRFDDLQAETNAGSLQLRGIAHTVTARSSAGDSMLDLANVETARLEVSAGRMMTTLGGTAPSDVTATVSAGVLDLGVPDGPYTVTSGVTTGAFHNSLGTSSGSGNTIHADVSAGSMTLYGVSG